MNTLLLKVSVRSQAQQCLFSFSLLRTVITTLPAKVSGRKFQKRFTAVTDKSTKKLPTNVLRSNKKKLIAVPDKCPMTLLKNVSGRTSEKKFIAVTEKCLMTLLANVFRCTSEKLILLTKVLKHYHQTF